MPLASEMKPEPSSFVWDIVDSTVLGGSGREFPYVNLFSSDEFFQREPNLVIAEAETVCL